MSGDRSLRSVYYEIITSKFVEFLNTNFQRIGFQNKQHHTPYKARSDVFDDKLATTRWATQVLYLYTLLNVDFFQNNDSMVFIFSVMILLGQLFKNMNEFWNNLKKDVRQRRNIELYLVLLIGSIMIVLDFLGLASDYLSEAILGHSRNLIIRIILEP